MSEPMEHVSSLEEIEWIILFKVFNEKRNLQLFEIKDGSSETEQRCRVVCVMLDLFIPFYHIATCH